ncbi:2,3-bisphosphoglycerate-dependent phosphoglycerate mutase [Marininema mesophilum]|uniref:2,3-bisphosphoglycerate-dependent phosphoglycerate mutase n=1 Tax=Marininema mesophilum TaxID=1048340 RepID=A0A1H2ZFD5_9BACL|nr:histidine phosphatase family protein [Marininema mesophilum]SDX16203.1 2,3-bisphosphoglycerate-dependent phosphoglycerate mutase [Marininema mesophilum]
MEILLIRHGESEDDILGVHSNDHSLTPKGVEQAYLMANRVKSKFPPDFVWSSTLKRASKTAEILAETTTSPLQYLDDLREIQNGSLKGKLISEVGYPVDLKPYEKLGGSGESKIEFRARGERVLSLILDKSQSYQRIAIVSHGGMISMLMQSLLNLPMMNNNVFFITGNTGIHLLELSDNRQFIHLMNSMTHLEHLTII